MKGYGVFHNSHLIFTNVLAYAIYDKIYSAEFYMGEMQSRFPDETFSVRELEITGDK